MSLTPRFLLLLFSWIIHVIYIKNYVFQAHDMNTKLNVSRRHGDLSYKFVTQEKDGQKMLNIPFHKSYFLI